MLVGVVRILNAFETLAHCPDFMLRMYVCVRVNC